MESPILSTAKETFSKMLSILEAKGKDYAKESDPYQNFRLAEKLLNISTKKGITVRLLEKVSRICNLLEKESDVKDETIEDTINDLIGLAIVLKSYLRSGNSSSNAENEQDPSPMLANPYKIHDYINLWASQVPKGTTMSISELLCNWNDFLVKEYTEERNGSSNNNSTVTDEMFLNTCTNPEALSTLFNQQSVSPYANAALFENDGEID